MNNFIVDHSETNEFEEIQLHVKNDVHGSPMWPFKMICTVKMSTEVDEHEWKIMEGKN